MRQWRVGRVYSHFEGRPLFEYDCTFGPTMSGGCCHFTCRMEAIRRAGHGDVASQLEANAAAKDWLCNWGKLLYDPREHGQNPQRRKAAAEVIRAMRTRSVGYAEAVRTGAWAGALMAVL